MDDIFLKFLRVDLFSSSVYILWSMGDSSPRHAQPPSVFSATWILDFVRTALTRDIARFPRRFAQWNRALPESGSSQSIDQDMAPVESATSKSDNSTPKTCHICERPNSALRECTDCHQFCDSVCASLFYGRTFTIPEGGDKWQCPDCSENWSSVSMEVDSTTPLPRASPPPRASTPSATTMPFPDSATTVANGVENMTLMTPKSSSKKIKKEGDKSEKSKKRKNGPKVESPSKRQPTPSPSKMANKTTTSSSSLNSKALRSLSPSPMPSRSMTPTPTSSSAAAAKAGTASTSTALMKAVNGGAEKKLSTSSDDQHGKDEEFKLALATVQAHLPYYEQLRVCNSEFQDEIAQLKKTVDAKEEIIWEMKDYNENLQDRVTELEIKCGKLEDKLKKIRRLSGANVFGRDDHDERDEKDAEKDEDLDMEDDDDE